MLSGGFQGAVCILQKLSGAWAREGRMMRERAPAFIPGTYPGAVCLRELLAACQPLYAPENGNRIIQSPERINANIEPIIDELPADTV